MSKHEGLVRSVSAKFFLRLGRVFFSRLGFAAMSILCFALLSRAGGPGLVAGSSYFDSSDMGQPLVWPGGVITYYTDQGDLSPVLPNATANALVANAFSQWTAVTTAALTANNGGQLAEDVNGSNLTVNSQGVITAPADITPSAIDTPVGVVYDYDGSVTDILLGAGAGESSQCFSNAVYGGADNFGATATYEHALIVIDGQCALASTQLTDVEYRLVRTIGSVLGLGWSQLNLNVITGDPPPTSDDLAGFPVMHFIDPVGCVPITMCYADPYQLAMDDQAAISRLYPVTAENQASFTGKQLFAATTARVYGSVYFTDSSGNPTQPMQGVNVVARWINPATGNPSGEYAASSVSGFLFTGNAGNPITGFEDALRIPFSQWGSDIGSVEGFFDLSGLQIPGGGTAQYQLTVEAIDQTWSFGVEPYAPNQVTPSGLMQPIVVTLTAGQEEQQDILMSQNAEPVPQWSPPESWNSPTPVPQAGDWEGSLGSYGDAGYFSLTAQANRTLSVAVTALDESGGATENKVEPVIGMWSASAAQRTLPTARTTSPFNSSNFAMTRLDTQVAGSGTFLIGIADLRGDGRPDYHYHAQLLYGDSVSPTRVGVAGGAVTVQGIGFSPRLAATVGDLAATTLAASGGQIVLYAPPQGDGPQSVTLTDPTTGGSTTLANAVTYGAAATDTIVLVDALNPLTPAGTQATNPVVVRVLASDGVTPISGATIGWTASNGVQLSTCGGASSCSVTSDQGGRAATWLTPIAAGTSTITATLAPGVYNPAQSVSATLSASESASAIGVTPSYLWIAQGASVSVPLMARVLNDGVPQSGAQVNFTIASGSGTLSAASAPTNSGGYASVTLSVAQFGTPVQVNACVGVSNIPCQQVYANPVPLVQLNLQQVAGAGQISTAQTFQPIVVRVVDSASPPHAVLAATVNFQTTVMREAGSSGTGGGGTNPVMPVILSVSQSNQTTDINGLANITPSSGGFAAPLEVNVAVSAGTSATLDDSLQLLPPLAGGDDSGGTNTVSTQLPRR